MYPRNLAHMLVTLAIFTQLNAQADEVDLSHLSLSQAEQLFQTNSRELLQAKRAVEASVADSLSASQRPNPTLSLNTSNFKLGQSNGGSGLDNKTLDTIVRIDQLIERGGKREIRQAAAQNAIQASQFDFKDTLRVQKLQLRSTYYDLLLAEEKEKVQSSNQELLEKTLQATEIRLKAGDVPATDVSRIRVDVLRALNDLRQAQADREKAQADLAYLLGKEATASSLVAVEPWPSLDTAAAPAVSAESTLELRPDIKAANAREQQANENRRLAQALLSRDIVIGAQYEHFPTDSRNTIGAGISIPLQTNYQYQGEIARSEVDYTSAIEAKEQVRALALGEIAHAQADLNASSEKLRRFDQQILAEAKKAAESAEFAYQHGAANVTDLLDARRVYRSLELEAINVRAEYAKSLATWQAVIHPEEN